MNEDYYDPIIKDRGDKWINEHGCLMVWFDEVGCYLMTSIPEEKHSLTLTDWCRIVE